MNKKILLVLSTSILSSFVAPGSAFEELGEVSLKPMEKPSPMVSGTEQHWLKHGLKDNVVHIIYYESVDAEKYSVRGSDGCWTRITGMFSPALVWKNCHGAGRSGTQEIIKTMGNPWPLSEKTEFQYEFAGKWDDGFGAQWHITQICKVDKQVRVKVPAGEFDTYKLVCDDPGEKYTYWISPELGHHVALERKDKFLISRSYMLEFVKVVNP